MGSFVKELIERRVPHAAVGFIPALWLVVEATSWAEARYHFAPHITDAVALGTLALLPSVLLFTWNHGREGEDEWKRSEFVFFGLNLLAVAFLVTRVEPTMAESPATPKSVVADSKQVAEPEPEPQPELAELEALLPPSERTCILLAAPALPSEEKTEGRWKSETLEYALGRGLGMRPSLRPVPVSTTYAGDLENRKLRVGDALPSALLAELGERDRCPNTLTGRLSQSPDGPLRLTLELVKSGEKRVVDKGEFEAADLLSLAEKAIAFVHEELGSSGEDEMPLREALSGEPKVLELLGKAQFAILSEAFHEAETLGKGGLSSSTPSRSMPCSRCGCWLCVEATRSWRPSTSETPRSTPTGPRRTNAGGSAIRNTTAPASRSWLARSWSSRSRPTRKTTTPA